MDEIAKPDQLLEKLADDLKILLVEREIDDPLMVGIHTGGAWIANKLHAKLGISRPLATLDISFYRDDFSRIGMNPRVKPSSLPPQVEDRHIILVDDVLQTRVLDTAKLRLSIDGDQHGRVGDELDLGRSVIEALRYRASLFSQVEHGE